MGFFGRKQKIKEQENTQITAVHSESNDMDVVTATEVTTTSTPYSNNNSNNNNSLVQLEDDSSTMVVVPRQSPRQQYYVELGTINYINLTPDGRHGEYEIALQMARETGKPIFANFVEWSG